MGPCIGKRATLLCCGRKASGVGSKMSAGGLLLLLCLSIQFARNLHDRDDHLQKSIINRDAKHDGHLAFFPRFFSVVWL
jgi:hypothetical protein